MFYYSQFVFFSICLHSSCDAGGDTIEKASAAAAAAASKAVVSAAAARRRDQRLCKGCSVIAGADRATLCHLNEGSRCPNADRVSDYPAGGYKKTK